MADIDISQQHNEYRLEGTLQHLSLGPAAPKMQVYPLPRPAPGDPPTTPLLVEIELDDPPGVVSSGVLPITATGTFLVVNSGEAGWARFVNGSGEWSIDARVSDASGDAPVRLSDTTLFAGGQVALILAVLG